MDNDSVLSRLNDSEGAAAVTRADRCPISAPPTPTASAIDSEAFADGWAGCASAGAVSAGAGEDGVVAEDDGSGSAVPSDGEDVVGVGAGSAANAKPARPGLATKEAASRIIAKDFMAGRRD